MMFVPVFRSSGDELADSRFAAAKAAVEAETYGKAAEILAEVLELVPHWAPALFLLGIAHDKLSHRQQAIAVMERAAELDFRGELGAGLQLARFGVRPSPRSAAAAYVQNLFDQYAAHFERHLVGALAYCGPRVLFEAVMALQRGPFAYVLDLGCGTGLCGAAFRAEAKVMCGVDLSAGMVDEARRKAIYDRLEVADVETHLGREADESVDLLLAADVFVYIGDIAPILREAQRVLAPEGLFAFTVQEGSDDFAIGPDLRYAHSPAYIEQQASHSGLRIVSMKQAVTRRENDQDVEGLVVIVKRA